MVDSNDTAASIAAMALLHSLRVVTLAASPSVAGSRPATPDTAIVGTSADALTVSNKKRWSNIKKRFVLEFRRIHEEMCQSHECNIPQHRAFGDALALCLVAIVGVAMLLIA